MAVYSFTAKELAHLLEVASLYTSGDSLLIQERYQRHASNFVEALDFLIKLGLMNKEQDTLTVSPRLRGIQDVEVLVQIIKDLLLVSDKFTDIYRLLSTFEKHENRFEYRPTIEERFKDSYIRNLLLRMDIIKHDLLRDTYFIEPGDYSAIVSGRTGRRKKLSLEAFKLIEKNRELIGSMAEQIVLKYERDRLSSNPMIANKISYTAEQDEGAGYDITSFESAKDIQNRFIEVKAVSPADYCFNWSANEVEVAKKLGYRYYLYLVPIIKGLPCVEEAQIIRDPITTILCQDGTWSVEIEGYTISYKHGAKDNDLGTMDLRKELY